MQKNVQRIHLHLQIFTHIRLTLWKVLKNKVVFHFSFYIIQKEMSYIICAFQSLWSFGIEWKMVVVKVSDMKKLNQISY